MKYLDKGIPEDSQIVLSEVIARIAMLITALYLNSVYMVISEKGGYPTPKKLPLIWGNAQT